jgi:hypothetical protein
MLDTERKASYKAFGLTVRSEIPLPELPQTNAKERIDEILIEFSDLSQLWRELNGQQGKFKVTENLVMFQIPNTAIFCIQEGRKISISPLGRADEDKIRLYLLGTCMGALLMQRRVLPLHGSAVAINGKAYAFVGDSGAGKSTLAAAFLHRGFELLSDDIIALTFSKANDVPVVVPSYPQQKLWRESLVEFGLDTSNYRPLFERETKYAVPVISNFFSTPMPLAGIFELVKSEEKQAGIVPIKGLQQLYTLFVHTFRNFIVPRSGLIEWHFHQSAKIAKQVEMFQISRPSFCFTAPHLVSLILETI